MGLVVVVGVISAYAGNVLWVRPGERQLLSEIPSLGGKGP